MGNLSPSGETLFRTLTVAKNAPFSVSPMPSSRRPDFYPKFGQSPAVISSQKWGHFGDTWIALDFPKILGKSGGNLSPSGGALFRNLIGDKGPPCSAPIRPSSRGPDFYPKFGQSPAAISSRKRGHFGDTWVSRDFRKILGISRK